MTTPTEKAKELVSKYYDLLHYEFGDDVGKRDRQPHQCAIIFVDGMLSQNNASCLNYTYWEAVKFEIEKL